MRIAVNGKSLGVAEKGGAVKVALSLIRHMALAGKDMEIHVYLPLGKGERVENGLFPSSVTCHIDRSDLFRTPQGRALWEQIFLPLRLRRGRGADLLFNPTNTAPILISPGIPQVLLVHDLGFVNTEWFSSTFSRYLKFVVGRAADRGVRFVSVSECTSKEIARMYPQLEDVKTFLNAVDPAPQAFPEIEFDGPYALFLGNLNPRKNLRGGISGFQVFRQRTGSDLRLVMMGAERPFFGEQGLESASLEGVHFVGYVDGPEKWAWLRKAEVLLLPSFLESFGLPVLEAMNVGTPSVVSDIPAFRELYADAVEYVDPYSENDIARGIMRVLGDPERKRRMTERGKEVAARFSWEKSALGYIGFFQEILASRDGCRSHRQDLKASGGERSHAD